MTKKKGVAAYVRVSTTSQNAAGQKAEINQWLEGNDIDADSVQWFIDKKSGDNLQRPAFEKLQDAVFAGEISTVIVWKLDRLSRDLQDGMNTICDWCKKNMRVVSVTQQIDFNGTVGQIIANVLLGIGQMEQETRRERQAAGIAVAKGRGVYKGREKGTTKAKPQRARTLKDKGMTNPEIATALGVSRMTVIRYLKQANGG